MLSIINLSDIYLRKWIKTKYKLHAGTWNYLFCIRAYFWDDDSWALVDEDIKSHNIDFKNVINLISKAGAKAHFINSLILFRTRKEAWIASRVINEILYVHYKEIAKQRKTAIEFSRKI